MHNIYKANVMNFYTDATDQASPIIRNFACTQKSGIKTDRDRLVDSFSSVHSTLFVLFDILQTKSESHVYIYNLWLEFTDYVPVSL